jgi:hypothetical protein
MSYGERVRQRERLRILQWWSAAASLITADAALAPTLALSSAKQLYIEIYFCNTQMKQLQHTFKTDEHLEYTLATYPL